MPQARHYMRITKEDTFGTADATPGAGDRAVLHIGQSNANTIRATPIQWSERSAGGSNREVMRGSEQLAVGGNLKSILFPDQAALWLNLIFGIAGTPYELPSFTTDEVVVMEDSGRTANYFSHLGCKVISGSLTATNKGNGVLWMLDLNIAGKQPRTITSSDFAEPALSTYPTGPFVLQDTALTVGSALTNFESIKINFTNIIPTDQFDESLYVQRLPWCGRNITFDIRALFKTAQHRTDFEASTPKDCSIVIDNGTVEVTLDFNTANYYTKVVEDVTMDTSYMLDISFTNAVDLAAGTDLTVAVV